MEVTFFGLMLGAVVMIIAGILFVYISRDRESASTKLYKQATNTQSDIERTTVTGVNKVVSGVGNACGSVKRSIVSLFK